MESIEVKQAEPSSRITLNPRVVDVSIIIPVHNEAKILDNLIVDLSEHLGNYYFPSEILICENGSYDGSREIATALVSKNKQVRLISLGKPSYGAAIRDGILHSSSEYVFIFNADLWCLNFFSTALRQLRSGVDLVVGSKLLPRAVDHRHVVRRMISRGFNLLLRTFYGFKGTDTHGLKALRRSSILPILKRCLTEGEVFDTELVLRAQKDGLKISEVPVIVQEGRAPRLSLLRRVPSTLRDLILIRKTL